MPTSVWPPSLFQCPLVNIIISTYFIRYYVLILFFLPLSTFLCLYYRYILEFRHYFYLFLILLSVLFLAFSTPWMVVGICFAKTFLFSFVSLGILMSFGSGGWLLRFFLLFGDCAAMPLLYWYWSRYICTSIGLRWIAVSAAFLLVLLLITSLDYRVFAPLVCLIDSMKG